MLSIEKTIPLVRIFDEHKAREYTEDGVWDGIGMSLIDPFGNKLLFSEVEH
ncbi:MAG: hypothetical protein IPK76_15965 [Lewinellaceae bacterium]|jgi:hypothetical protein|nr:hypothetical protein [Lewinellaceae bacterium]